MVRGIVRHFHAGTNCPGQNGGMHAEKRWINMETSRGGWRERRVLNGDIPAVASWSRPTHTFYPARKLSDATSSPSCSSVPPPRKGKNIWKHNPRSKTVPSVREHHPPHWTSLEMFPIIQKRGSRMALRVWNTSCFCNLGLFVNLLMGLDFPWQIAV